jgi:hypothetical protein
MEIDRTRVAARDELAGLAVQVEIVRKVELLLNRDRQSLRLRRYGGRAGGRRRAGEGR